jgi:hypothetical protein
VATEAFTTPRGRREPRHAVPRSSWETRLIVTILVTFGLAMSSVLVFAIHSSVNASPIITATTLPVTNPAVVPFPVGRANRHEPSGMAPPGPNALAGFVRTYTADFVGTALPPGWLDFTGIPGGDPAGQFAATHVVVSDGLLHLNTWRDPRYADKWASGGLCQCGRPVTYGAFFVRSRITGKGPNEVELLWPADNQWPPEIDFNETGNQVHSTSFTIHYGTPQTGPFQELLKQVDMTRWNTWGVIWTPTKITFTVNGTPWGYFTDRAAIPHMAMTLDLEQRPGCWRGPVCTTQGQSMQVDWVAEYTARPPLASNR